MGCPVWCCVPVLTCCVWLRGCVCDQEERLAAARVALGDLAALVGMLVRESGAKYLGENVGDELLDLLGLDDVAVAVRCPLRAFSHGASWPASLTMLCLCLCLCLWLWRTCARLQDTPDDAEAKGAEGTVDADAEGESKDGAAGGESKAAGDAGESKGESKGADAGADGDNGDDGGDGEDGGGEGGDATSDAGADDAEEPIVRVSHAQVVTALDAFEATIRASQSVRLALLGGPGAGKKTVAKALASKLGLAVLNFGNLLADARYRADSEAQAAEDNDEEAVDKAAVVRAAVAERLQSEDCAKGWVFVNVPDDAEVVGTILSDLRASQLETVPVVLAAGDRQARQRRFGGSDPSEKEEEDYVQASVSWRRKGDAVIAAAAGGASHVARVDANAAPEAVLQSVLDELSDAHLLPTPYVVSRGAPVLVGAPVGVGAPVCVGVPVGVWVCVHGLRTRVAAACSLPHPVCLRVGLSKTRRTASHCRRTSLRRNTPSRTPSPSRCSAWTSCSTAEPVTSWTTPSRCSPTASTAS